VSAHYLVGRDGSVWQLVDESARAWHAGESRWGSLTDLNSASIGIELDNSGDEPFAEAQIQALLGLLDDVTARHRIPRRNVLGHGDVAPWRKADPGALFPWDRLARHGFGLWCYSPPVTVPADFDSRLAFQAVGYDLRDMGATRAAFRRHYLGRESSMDLEEGEMALLHCLAQQQSDGTGR
jgi:N-acetylmuramoyl-L-alanine amidase